MKISVFDPNKPKFMGDVVERWQQEGHEVRYDRYYDPDMVEWADVIWFDTCDNNLASGTNPSQALKDEWKYEEHKNHWDMHDVDLTGKKVICRPLDIEVWLGHQGNSDWSLVNDAVFIAPHIKELAKLPDTVKQHIIPCGVDLNKWTFRNRKPGKNIAVVAERWVSKGPDLVLQLAHRLRDYKIYWLGRYDGYVWDDVYFRDHIEKNKLNIEIVDEFVPNLDQWLEDKDFLLSCSKKEAFGYNIAEAMAKGIKPIIHQFYGHEPIWGDSKLTWATVDQACKLIKDGYDSESYRQYLVDKGYTLDAMISKFKEVING